MQKAFKVAPVYGTSGVLAVLVRMLKVTFMCTYDFLNS